MHRFPSQRPHYYVFLLFLLGLHPLIQVTGQEDDQQFSGQKGVLIQISYGAQLPAGDLADRFGANFSPGIHIDYLLPSNWSLGLEGTYQFGRKVKQDVLSSLRNDRGYILSDNGGFADVVLRERGLYLGGYGSKFWSNASGKSWSGWNLKLGAGLLQHKIRIQNNSRDVNLLLGDSKKGYDRLCNGMAAHIAFGYKHLSFDRRVNYYIGLECMAGKTENRRSWNYDENRAPEDSRFDLHIGIRAAWILPFYSTAHPQTIYY